MQIRHIDTCLGSFLTDHCNGKRELLIGAYVNSSTRVYHVKDQLHSEIRALDLSHKDEFDHQAAHAVIDEAFRGVHPLKVFDPSLDKPADYEEAGEECQAWFRFSW